MQASPVHECVCADGPRTRRLVARRCAQPEPNVALERRRRFGVEENVERTYGELHGAPRVALAFDDDLAVFDAGVRQGPIQRNRKWADPLIGSSSKPNESQLDWILIKGERAKQER